jgi:hypothetical protein
VVTGLTTVQGQLVTVKVVAWKAVSILIVFTLEPGLYTAIVGLSQRDPRLLGSTTYLRDGVGHIIVGQGGGLWAVGGVGGVHISDVNDAAGVVRWVRGLGGTSEGGNGDNSGELHLDGLLILLLEK